MAKWLTWYVGLGGQFRGPDLTQKYICRLASRETAVSTPHLSELSPHPQFRFTLCESPRIYGPRATPDPTAISFSTDRSQVLVLISLDICLSTTVEYLYSAAYLFTGFPEEVCATGMRRREIVSENAGAEA